MLDTAIKTVTCILFFGIPLGVFIYQMKKWPIHDPKPEDLHPLGYLINGWSAPANVTLAVTNSDTLYLTNYYSYVGASSSGATEPSS